MKKYEIWQEGYAATGNTATAAFVGFAYGNDFDDAVKSFMRVTPNHGIQPIVRKRFPFSDENEKIKWHIWGCRLFDNEEDARKEFG